jgi:ABC-type uncharacterized transport system auxiliary subunit
MHDSLAAGKGCLEVSTGRDGRLKYFAGWNVEAFPAPRWHQLRVVRRQVSRNLHDWMSARLIPVRDYDCNPGRWSPAVRGYASDIQGKSATLRHDSKGETHLTLRASPIVDPENLLVKRRSGIINTTRWLAPPRSAFSLHRRMWFLAAWLAVFVIGCAVRSGDVVTYHSFNYPVPLKDTPAPIPGTLMIYRFLLAPEVNTDFLVVSQGKGKEESVPYHRWVESPADMITDLIERDLARSGLFERTVGQFSTVRYRYALEGKIIELRGVTGHGKPRAVIEVETTLIDFGAPLGARKNLMQRRYRIEIPCKDSSPASIVEGLNRAVREVSVRLRDDLRSTLAQKISSKAQPV